MTVATADKESTYTTYTFVRLYYIITGPITVDWGDGKYDTITDSKYSYGEEGIIYHNYASTGIVNTISIKQDTGNVKWFHVISSTSNNMGACIGTGNTDEGFDDFKEWANGYIEFICYNAKDKNLEDSGLLEDEIASVCANSLMDSLVELPSNKYINEYIDILSTFII